MIRAEGVHGGRDADAVYDGEPCSLAVGYIQWTEKLLLLWLQVLCSYMTRVKEMELHVAVALNRGT